MHQVISFANSQVLSEQPFLSKRAREMQTK